MAYHVLDITAYFVLHITAYHVLDITASHMLVAFRLDAVRAARSTTLVLLSALPLPPSAVHV